MSPDEARRRFAAQRVARLATADEAGRPHLVPITFCCDFGPAGDVVGFAVDFKPKTTHRLKRLANIAVNPAVSVLVDHYDDDWQRLWWVRADGSARVSEDPAERDAVLGLLAEKYPQYRKTRPDGPVVVVEVSVWRGWSAQR